VAANPALRRKRVLSPTRTLDTPQARGKSTSWTLSTRAVRWNQPLNAQPPSHWPLPDPHLWVHRENESPPKARWFNPLSPGGEKTPSIYRQLAQADVGAA
jgi:hypothetical protein